MLGQVDAKLFRFGFGRRKGQRQGGYLDFQFVADRLQGGQVGFQAGDLPQPEVQRLAIRLDDAIGLLQRFFQPVAAVAERDVPRQGIGEPVRQRIALRRKRADIRLQRVARCHGVLQVGRYERQARPQIGILAALQRQRIG